MGPDSLRSPQNDSPKSPPKKTHFTTGHKTVSGLPLEGTHLVTSQDILHTFRVRHGDTGTWGLGDMVPLDHLSPDQPLGLDMRTRVGFRGHGV